MWARALEALVHQRGVRAEAVTEALIADEIVRSMSLRDAELETAQRTYNSTVGRLLKDMKTMANAAHIDSAYEVFAAATETHGADADGVE